jgi:Trk K+ transport system NAD-binding subunit
VIIKRVATYSLWNRGIDSISAVIYLQQSDSQRLTVQEMQCKSFDTPDVIENVRSKRKILSLIILNFLISVISNIFILA